MSKRTKEIIFEGEHRKIPYRISLTDMGNPELANFHNWEYHLPCDRYLSPGLFVLITDDVEKLKAHICKQLDRIYKNARTRIANAHPHGWQKWEQAA